MAQDRQRPLLFLRIGAGQAGDPRSLGRQLVQVFLKRRVVQETQHFFETQLPRFSQSQSAAQQREQHLVRRQRTLDRRP